AEHAAGRPSPRAGGHADHATPPVREGVGGGAGAAEGRPLLCDPADRLSDGTLRPRRAWPLERVRLPGSLGTALRSGLTGAAAASAPVAGDALVEEAVVLLTNRRGGLVIEEGQEDVAPAGGYRQRFVQQGAGEDDRTAGRRLVGLRAEFRKAQRAAFELLRIEVEGHR